MVRQNNYPRNIKIYRIDNIIEPENFYVGSTSERYLSTRMNKHRHDAKNRTKLSKLWRFMHEKGIDNFKISLIAEHNVKSWDEQLQKEQHYIKLLNPTLNQQAAYNTKEEEKQKLKQASLNLRTRNRENNRFYCYDCDYSFSYKNRLADHLMGEKHWQNVMPFSVSVMEYYCEDCDTKLSYSGNITHFSNYHHLNKQLPFNTKEYDYWCSQCDCVFTTKSDLGRHYKSQNHQKN